MAKHNSEMHKGHRQRMKNKVLKLGLDALEPHEILEWILMYTIPYKDVNPLAHELEEHFGSIANVFDAGYDQLYKFNGVGHETALLLSTLPELFNVYSASKQVGKVVLSSVSICINYFRSIKLIGDEEEMYAFCLDGKYRLLQLVKIAHGDTSSVLLNMPRLANKILCKGVTSVVFLHTHPNGDVTPSKADFIATKRLINLCYTLGLKVEDHIILNETNYYSFVKTRAFQALAEEAVRAFSTTLNESVLKYLISSSFDNSVPRPKILTDIDK